jgi:ABC-2 type transport system permease protein
MFLSQSSSKELPVNNQHGPTGRRKIERLQDYIRDLAESTWDFVIRISSFLRKELVSVLRQPRLILTLILGPFLILLLFGLGFTSQGQTLRALFVVPEDSELRQYVQEYATTLGPQLAFAGITNSEADARSQLRRGQVDIIVLTPSDAFEQVRNNEQAIFQIYHNEINPVQDNYIRFVGRIYVEEVNRRVLQSITQEGQEESLTVQDDLDALRSDVAAVRQALERKDITTARRALRDTERHTTGLELTLAASAQVLGTVRQVVGTSNDDQLQGIVDALTEIQRAIDALDDLDSLGDANLSRAIDRVSTIEDNLDILESHLNQFNRISPGVLVSPFGANTLSIANVRLDFTDYYTPAVIVLLLQHLCVTFAALSIVRERLMGTVELFQVSPVSSLEILIGKYTSFTLFAGALTLILTLLVITVLEVPMLGAWLNYLLAILLTILTALGIGFLISLLSNTTTQAVQYAMIVLLASVFFTGFIQEVDLLRPPARYVSWMLPATYGIRLLQNIMLRGRLFNLHAFLILAGICAILFVINWFLLRRQMRQS